MSKPPSIKTLSNLLQPLGLNGEVFNLQRITIGANKEVWRFDLKQINTQQSLILKRNPFGEAEYKMPPRFAKTNIQTEAKLISKLASNGLKVPKVIARFHQGSPLGEGFIMTLEQGESLPRRVLGLDNLKSARDGLAAECGQQLATLHGVELGSFAQVLPDLTIEQRLAQMEESSQILNNESAVHALARQWLCSNVPDHGRRCIVHGDFRLGNLLVHDGGLNSILDWELARVSHPEEDLGYLTAMGSRYGEAKNVVGGFGQYEQLLDAYEQVAGWRPELRTILFWQLYSAVSWGVVCLSMQQMYLSGQDRSARRLAVARRFSESEVDILLLLDQLS